MKYPALFIGIILCSGMCNAFAQKNSVPQPDSITRKYKSISDFSEGFAVVVNEIGHYRFLNKKMEEVFDSTYDVPLGFSEGLACVCIGGYKCGYIDSVGKLQIPCKYPWFSAFKEGLAVVGLDDPGRFGYMDHTGKVVIPFEFQYATSFCENRAKVAKNNRVGFIDHNGKLVIDYKYSDAGEFREGRALVTYQDQKIGYIDTNGNETTPMRFSFGTPFSGGVAIVGKYVVEDHTNKRLSGVIDKYGKIVVPLEYDFIDSFALTDGTDTAVALAGYDDKRYLIRRSGTITSVDANYYCNIDYRTKNLHVIYNEEKKGLADKYGKIIAPCIYNNIGLFHDGLAVIRYNDYIGYIDENGTVLKWFIKVHIDPKEKTK